MPRAPGARRHRRTRPPTDRRPPSIWKHASRPCWASHSDPELLAPEGVGCVRFMGRRIRAYVMGRFRNQLLVLIIGLIVVTQSVTLVAVLARVETSVAARAEEQ